MKTQHDERLLSLVRRSYALLSDPDADPMTASLLEDDLHACLKDMGELEPAPAESLFETLAEITKPANLTAACHCGADTCNAQHPDA